MAGYKLKQTTTAEEGWSAVHWRRRLAHAPDWALEEEINRRREGVPRFEAITIGELTVDPFASLVRWRGDDYAVRGRRMEVLWSLAQDRLAGRIRTPSTLLAHRIWSGWTAKDACNQLRSCIHEIRRHLPGLILPSEYSRGYGLAIPRDTPGHRERVA